MCDICGRSSCATWFHSSEEQERYAKVIDAFDKARDLRDTLRRAIAEEEQEESN
jgi:transcription elongation factor Elf1